MKIEIGHYAGFCRGVKHAVNSTFACARETDGEILTDGELIHNPQTLKLLEQHDVRVLRPDDDLEQVRDRLVVIRAHGVPPQRLAELKQVAREVRNLTCRDVAKVQGIIRNRSNKGCDVVIFGKKDHPEVVGLVGYARRGFVVASVEEVDALPPMDKVLVVSQTTMSTRAFREVSQRMLERYQDVEVVDTICDATGLRQNEVRELASRNDCVLVIGSKTSSNTQRLYEIASEQTRAYLIADPEDLDAISFKDVRTLGLTAGASTPDWLIQEVAEEVRRRGRGPLLGLAHNLLRFSLYSRLFVALGAYLLSFAVADILGVPFTGEVGLLVALYYLSMALLNTYTGRRTLEIDHASRHRFNFRHRHLLLAMFIIATALLLGVAFRLSYEILVLTLFSFLLGVAYNLSYLPVVDAGQRVLGMRTRDLQALKSFVISLAVTLLLNGLPVLRQYPHVPADWSAASVLFTRLGVYFSVYYVFLLMFTRQALFEIKTAQTDRIAGVSSLLNLMRAPHLTVLLYALPTVLLIAMAVGVAIGLYPLAKAKYFVAVGYNYLVIILSSNRRILHSHLTFELLAESNVYVAGLVALI